ncbi:MAG: ABC transporter ATP-binding protein, partial [Pseudomonadota bacterium]
MTLEGGALGVMSYMVQPLFDEVFVAGDAAAVRWIALVIGGIFVLRAIAGFGQRVLVMGVGLKVTTALQTDMLNHLLGLDARYFQDNAPGALIERVRGDTLALQAAASGALMTLGRDTISILSLIAVMLWVDWIWTAVAFLGVPVLMLPLAGLQAWIRGTSRRAREVAGTLSTRLDEIFHGVVSIKVNRLERHEAERFDGEVAGFLDAQIRAETGKAALPAVIDVIAAMGFLGVLIYGGGEILAGTKSVGDFMSFFTAMALLFDPLRRLSSVSGQIQGAAASLERIYAVLDARAHITSPEAPQPIAPGEIRFEDVAFAYGEAEILRGLSFVAEEGKVTALVGPSGAGKSTVFGLLTRLIDKASGRVTIGGRDVADAALEDLRSLFAVVGQDAALFDETIAENIRLGRLDASAEEIATAAEVASVTEFADKQPDGLATRVGPRGSALSGGQKQRVAIARAVLRDAPILLLDEPTSALDTRSEAVVQEALARLSKGRTTLVIAHRLSTV